MSEKAPNNQEHQTYHIEDLDSHPESRQNSPEKSINRHAEQLESIRRGIEKQALSKEHLDQTAEANPHNPDYQPHITRQIKAQTYKNTLKNIQARLPKMQANFSKFIHQPKIESISEVGAKTIARPSGIFSGSLIALIGSIVIIVIAKRIGFYVTPAVFAALFIFGFLIGLIIELLVKTIKRIVSKPQKYHY